MPAVALSVKDQSGQLPLQRNAQCLANNTIELSTHVSLHIQKETYGATMQNSLPNSGRTFRERFSDALRRRLAPNTNLTVSQLAGAIGVSDNTVKNLLSKANEPSARVIDECVRLFKDSFLNEIYGCHHIHCLDTRAPERAALVMQQARIQEELRRLA
jgi:transcriptional regulator with XRE-family HTH domain